MRQSAPIMSEYDPLQGYSEGTTPSFHRVKKGCLNCRLGVLSSVLFAASLSVAFLLLLALQPGVLPGHNITAVVEDLPAQENLLKLTLDNQVPEEPVAEATLGEDVFSGSLVEPVAVASDPVASDPVALPEPVALPDPVPVAIDPDLVARCLQHGKDQLVRRKALEESLYHVYQTTRKESPTFFHQMATPQTVEALHMVDASVLSEETLKCLRQSGAQLDQLPDSALRYLKKHWPHCSSHDWPYWAVADIKCSHYQTRRSGENKPKYRSLDGSCNNLRNPLWGTAFRPYRRILPSEYDDGFSTPRNTSVHHTGGELPPGRQVSQCMQNATNQWTEPRLSQLFVEFAHFLDQDIASTAASRGRNGTGIPCCGTSPMHPECYPHILKFNDVFYKGFPELAESLCLDMVRSAPAPQCGVGPREQMNQASSYIDLSNIFSVTSRESHGWIRDHDGGYLRSPTEKDGRYMLQRSLDVHDGCNKPDMLDGGRYCFRAADSRVNVQIGLTAMYTIWMREHNRITDQFIKLNPRWDDERLYQESRRIVIAEMQHVTYNEFVPLLLGESLTDSLRLRPLKYGYSNDYDDTLNADVANEFAAAAFRFTHSMVQGKVAVEEGGGTPTDYLDLQRTMFNPFPLWTFGKIDALIRGSASHNPRPLHSSFTTQVANHLFQTRNMSWGFDLFAINIQRGRDHGIPPFFKWREICNLSPMTDFKDMKDHFRPHSLELITRFYKTAVDLDLYTGILSENPLPDGLLGPVGSCIISDQFVRLKRGDRFWYETGDRHLRFTPEQLASIRQVSFARILCDNGDAMDAIQGRAMESVSDANPKKRCSGDEIPRLDLNLWVD